MKYNSENESTIGSDFLHDSGENISDEETSLDVPIVEMPEDSLAWYSSLNNITPLPFRVCLILNT